MISLYTYVMFKIYHFVIVIYTVRHLKHYMNHMNLRVLRTRPVKVSNCSSGDVLCFEEFKMYGNCLKWDRLQNGFEKCRQIEKNP